MGGGMSVTLVGVGVGIGVLWALFRHFHIASLFSLPSLRYQISKTWIGYLVHLKGEKGSPHSTILPTELPGVKIVPVAMMDDNYGYLIIDMATGETAVVDASDPVRILSALEAERGAKLVAILTTHKHWDHSGGNSRLLEKFPHLKVYGSGIDQVPCANIRLFDGDTLKVGSLTFKAIESRVHTKGHLLFLLEHPETPSLFSGDAVFVAGAGKFFESTGSEFFRLAERLKKMNGATLLFPGHEYTLSNLIFAESLEPSNLALQEKLKWTKAKRAERLGTVPSTLAQELEYNPFFRYNQEEIREKLPPPPPGSISVESVRSHYVTEIRKSKDAFVPKPVLLEQPRDK